MIIMIITDALNIFLSFATMSNKTSETTRKWYQEKMEKAQKEVKEYADKVTCYAKEVASYGLKLKNASQQEKRLTNWAMYHSWQESLSLAVRQQTDGIFQNFYGALTYGAAVIAATHAVQMWNAVKAAHADDGVMAAVKNSAKQMMNKDALGISTCMRDVEAMKTESLPQYLEKIGKIFENIRNISFEAKKVVKKGNVYHNQVESSQNHAAEVLKCVIFAMAEFKRAMYVVCDADIYRNISVRLSHFLHHANILPLLKMFPKTFSQPSADSPWSMVFQLLGNQLVGELVATLVSEEDKKNMVASRVMKTSKVRFKTEQGEKWHEVEIPVTYTARVNLPMDEDTQIAIITVGTISKEVEEMRRLCLKATQEAEEEAMTHTTQAQAYATEVVRCASQLKDAYAKNSLKNWEMYPQWREGLSRTVKCRTDDFFQCFLHSLAHAMSASVFADVATVWVEVGRRSPWMDDQSVFSSAKELAKAMSEKAMTWANRYTQDADKGTGESLLLRERLKQLGEAFTSIQRVCNEAKIDVIFPCKISEYSSRCDLPEASSRKQIAKIYATKAAESAFLAITQFAEVMNIACSKSMYPDISCGLSCFLIDACIWRWVSGKHVDAFSDSCGSVVPQLMGKLVKTMVVALVAKKDKKALEIVMNEIDVHIIHRMYCWIQDGEDWVQLKQEGLNIGHYIEDTSYLMKDSDAYAICGSIHYLTRVIAMAKHAAFVSEAKKTMDDVIRSMACITSLGDPHLSAKLEKVTERWLEIVKRLAAGISGERYYPIIRLEATVLYKLHERAQEAKNEK
jgi:hypothetical protein